MKKLKIYQKKKVESINLIVNYKISFEDFLTKYKRLEFSINQTDNQMLKSFC